MKKYSVNNVEFQADDFWDWLEEALEDEADGPRYDEWLDDVSEGYLEIGSSIYYASDVLREMEPATYRVAKSDFIEHRREQCTDELEIDGETEANGKHFRIVEKEESD